MWLKSTRLSSLRLSSAQLQIPRLPAFRRMSSGSTTESLLRAFRDPSSPFYLREGEVGPASPDEHPHQVQSHPFSTTAVDTFTPDDTTYAEAVAEARAYALCEGHDPDSFFEQRIVWGDMDSFRHVNNTRYVRFLESGRIHWMASLAQEAGGQEAARNLLTGKGIGLILKSISVDFKRPVVYPDTLFISHRPRPTDPPSETHFNNDAIIYSYAQRKVVATSESVLVWYDYDKLQKAAPKEAFKEALVRRMQL